MRIPTRLLAVVATGIALSTVVSAASRVVVRPEATQSSAAPSGRVLFAGTQHRGLGVVTGAGSSSAVVSGAALSAPLFGPGPAHFDDQPSAVGAQLVFTSLRDAPTPQVYLRDAAGNVHQLTTGLDAADPRLSPDGTTVAFDAATVGPNGVGAQRHLWLVNTDGTGLRQLTDSAGNDIDPTFSPDGRQIAYSCDVTGTSQIYRIPAAGGPAVQLTTAGGSTQPAWNPVNAGEIAYSEDLGSGRRLRMIENGTPGLQVLSGNADDVQSFSPTWQPDGITLTFVSLVNGVNQVFEVDVAPCGCLPVPTPPQLLLDEDRGDDSPTWLNGQLVVARSNPPDQITADVEDVEPDGTDPRDLGLSVLREDPGAATDPNLLFNPHPGFDPWLERQQYSPDGRRIALSRFETVNGQRIERIWLADADGGDAAPMPLADRKPGDWETDAVWSPDGRLIAFTRQSPGGPNGGPTRVVIADVATGRVVATVPGQDPALNDAQPAWSPDGDTIAFTRVADIGGSLANKHIWITSLSAPDVQRDLTAQVCGALCPVIDDSPEFSPDGSTVALNRKDDAVLLVAADGSNCRVLLPVGQNSCAGAITAPNGPFQPRDVAYSPDGTQLMLTTRRCGCAASPETLALVNIATGQLRQIDSALPGRQKEPSWQQTVDLAVSAPPNTPAVPLNGGQTVPVVVTNHGPAPSPGSTLTVAVPPGLRIDGLRPDRGTCDVPTLTCQFGVLGPGQSIGVTATVVGTAPGTQTLTWSVHGTVLDSQPADNTADTVLPVQAPATGPPTSNPPGGPQLAGPAPANPALAVTVTPTPGYVGGTVTVTYTATNRAGGPATGLSLAITLPGGIPVGSVGGNCTVTGCALPDLAAGASTAVQVVLTPTAAVRTTVAGTLTTTGTDADPGDDTAAAPLVVLQPKIIAVPAIGKPGFVTSVRGTDFPPGVPVTFTWTPGITAAAVSTFPSAAGTFIGQLLILPMDQTGPRVITASGPGFSPVTTPFLVVPGAFSPPDLVERR